MDHDIDTLEIAAGLKEALVNNGLNVESILNFGPAQIASILGIDVYVGKIIFDETEKAVNNNDGLMLQQKSLIE